RERAIVDGAGAGRMRAVGRVVGLVDTGAALIGRGKRHVHGGGVAPRAGVAVTRNGRRRGRRVDGDGPGLHLFGVPRDVGREELDRARLGDLEGAAVDGARGGGGGAVGRERERVESGTAVVGGGERDVEVRGVRVGAARD